MISESLLDRAYVEKALPSILVRAPVRFIDVNILSILIRPQEKLDNLQGLPAYAPYLFLTEPEFIKSRPAFKPRASMSPEVPGTYAKIQRYMNRVKAVADAPPYRQVK